MLARAAHAARRAAAPARQPAHAARHARRRSRRASSTRASRNVRAPRRPDRRRCSTCRGSPRPAHAVHRRRSISATLVREVVDRLDESATDASARSCVSTSSRRRWIVGSAADRQVLIESTGQRVQVRRRYAGRARQLAREADAACSSRRGSWSRHPGGPARASLRSLRARRVDAQLSAAWASACTSRERSSSRTAVRFARRTEMAVARSVEIRLPLSVQWNALMNLAHRVLVVDDDTEIRETLLEVLEDAGYEAVGRERRLRGARAAPRSGRTAGASCCST